MSTQSQGQIITFYSYKGGTGRTMALANIACLLAEHQQHNGGKGVLMIDWDLEAPGLHRYFHNYLPGKQTNSNGMESPHDAEPGLIDLFYELSGKIDEPKPRTAPTANGGSQELSPLSEAWAQQAVSEVNFQKYILDTTIKGLSLMKAGRFKSQAANEYAERVSRFNWEAMYRKSPHLIRVFAEALAERYAYVLIDSRTGVTDISGICTMILPEKLVVVFTPNMQSLKSCLDLARQAAEYRQESGDLRRLLVYPLVSRVEASEPSLRHDWRFGNGEHQTVGFQPAFQNLLRELYERGDIALTRYFDEMQIQHVPRYAYGEEIAVLAEKLSDRLSLRRSYETFAAKLIDSHVPWEGDFAEPSTQSQPQAPTLWQSWLSGIQRIWRDPFTPFVLICALVLLVVVGLWQLNRIEGNKNALAVQNGALQSQLADAQKQLTELQAPLQAIKQKDQKINELFTQLTQVSSDRDTAKDALIKATADLNDAQTAQKTAQNQADRFKQSLNAAQTAQKEAETRAYTAEQQLKNCGGKARPMQQSKP